MSTYEQTTIHCVHCRAEIVCSMLVGMYITRLPEVRTAILNDDFQKVSCPKCDFVNIVEKPSILTDFERKHYIGIETSQTENWKDKVKNHRLAFEQTFLWGPPIARVFGVEGFGCPQCGEVMMLRAVSVLPPLAMTLLRAMNWRGPPMWVGVTDA